MGAPTKFTSRKFQQFLLSGSIHDAPRSGRPKKIPTDTAKEAAQMLKMGYDVRYIPNTDPTQAVTVRRYYTSVKQACEFRPELKNICAMYEVSPAQLLTRMHEVDPYLKKMKLHYKHELTDEQKGKRQRFAANMLHKIERDPHYLDGVFYMDEASIVVTSEHAHDIKVWADLHDKSFHQVLPCPHIPGNTKIKINFVVVVNPLEGAFFMDMLTGTSDILRLENLHPGTYKVRKDKHKGQLHHYQVYQMHPWPRVVHLAPGYTATNFCSKTSL